MTISDTLIGLVTEIEASDDRIKSENTHKSDIYKKAKSDGFNVKALRKVIAARRLDESERDHNDSDFDIYWSAIHGLVSARVEIVDEIQPETANKVPGGRPAKQGGEHEYDQVTDGLKSSTATPIEGEPVLIDETVRRADASDVALGSDVEPVAPANSNRPQITPGGTSIPFNGSIGG